MDNQRKYKFLFLDRDGVINVERPEDYAKNTSEFIFIDRALEAIALLSKQFEYIFVITNQRGVGRGVMSLSDLQEIHSHMLFEVDKSGGHITDFYFCTDINSTSINRKPNIGMAYQVQANHPIVDFSDSVMVGNSMSDIDFGNKLGMCTILVGDKYPKDHKIYNSVKAYYENLYSFAQDFVK